MAVHGISLLRAVGPRRLRRHIGQPDCCWPVADGEAKGKTSYLAEAGELRCSVEAEPVGRDEAGKT
jgi:hypothetical protein